MTITKEQTERLIDYLADKTLSFGCEFLKCGRVYICVDDTYAILKAKTQIYRTALPINTIQLAGKLSDCKILGHPVHIADVLDKIYVSGYGFTHNPDMIIGTWAQCGLKKSLQKIVEESEWEEYREPNREVDNEGNVCSWTIHETLKSPEANELLSFLWQIFEGEINK